MAPLTLPDLRPLPPVDACCQYAAIALFIQRARAAKPDFQVTTQNAPAVAEICHRLDGLPLSIELAAARVKLFPPHVLLQRLRPEGTRRLTLLTGGARDLHQRQQTLRNTIDWSFNLLDPAEQHVFPRLGIFVGGWTVAAMETLCDDSDVDAVDVLQSLVDKSLVRETEEAGADGEARFTMLETIREYALERLEATGAAEPLRQQHAAYFLAWAEDCALRSVAGDWEHWLSLFKLEQENLREALQWALDKGAAEHGLRLLAALWWFWDAIAPEEGRRRLAAALALPDQVPPQVRAKALTVAAYLDVRHGDYDDALVTSWAEESLVLCRALGDTVGTAWAMLLLAAVAAAQGTGRARELIDESLTLFVEVGDVRGITMAVWGHLSLSEQDRLQGDTAPIQGRLEEALEHFRHHRNVWASAMMCNLLGMLARDQDNYAEGTTWLEESLRLSRQTGDRWSIAIVLNDLGELALMQGDDVQARALEQASLDLFREVGDNAGRAWALTNLGYVAQHEGDHTRARGLHADALVLMRDLGNRDGIIECLAGVAGAVGGERAVRLFGQAEALREASQRQPMRAAHLEIARSITVLRTELDAKTFERSWAEGRAMSLEQAIAYALEESAGT